MPRKNQLPPGPTDHPAVQMRQFASRPASYFQELASRYGPVFTVRLLGQEPWVIVGDPDMVRKVFARTADGMVAAADGIKYMLGPDAILFLEGEAHKRERRLLSPYFHHREMQAYGDRMRESADVAIDALLVGEPVTASELMVDITLRTIVETVFGITEASRRARLVRLFALYMAMVQQAPWFIATLVVGGDRMRAGMDALTRLSSARFNPSNPPPSRWAVKRFFDARAEIDDILSREVARCRAEGDTGRDDLLARMLEARYEDGSAMTESHLRDQLMSLLIGGHETTALTMAWALYFIYRDPAVLARVRDELRASLAEGPLTHDRAGRLRYLGAVIDETLRFRPIAQNTPRKTGEPIELGGHVIPAGVQVFPSQMVLHFREDLWERPYDFRPERFLDGRVSAFQFFPFGGGSRTCLGRSFALAQMSLVLARVVDRVDFEVHPDAAPELAFHGILLGPSDGVPLVVRGVRPPSTPRASRAEAGSAA